MKFTRLKIHGFKTFVEASDVPIDNGLTGIVGPNGCGKSNLVESLRWVMGENSFKNMRASGMDDVIFSGSGNRPSRNTAEVQLVVDNHARTAPAPFNDADILEVSRRINRDAGSTYRINGREVRARDVQLLFADASTGARSPALVRQGQISEIINAKPQARRRVLEEAAGISGLHARRQEAETRLKAAEQNLDRLEDVLARVESEVETLKRQARQAVRYKALSGDIRKAEATIAWLRHAETRAQVGEGEAALKQAVAAVDAATLHQAEAAKQQAVAAYHLPALRDEAAASGASLQRLVIAREQLDGEDKRIRDKLAELDRRREQLVADIAREKNLVEDAEGSLARLRAEDAALQAEAAGGNGQSEALHAAMEAARAELTQAEQELAHSTAALATFNATRAQAERTLRDADERVARAEAQLQKLAADRAALAQSAPQHQLETLQQRFASAEVALHNAEQQSLAAEQASNEAARLEAEARRPVTEADRTVQRLEGEVRALTKLLAPSGPVRWVGVADSVTVKKGYEIALGAALGDDLDASLDAGAPMHWQGAEGAGDALLPAGVLRLADVVAAPAALTRRLNQIGVVEKAEAAALVPMLLPGQRLVSREGDLWRWDGFVAHANAPTAAARRLAEKNRLADIELELAGARLKADAARKVAASLTEKARAAAGHDQKMREAWRLAQRQLDADRETLAQAEREASHFASRMAAFEETAERLTAAHAEAQQLCGEAGEALRDCGNADALEATLATVQTRVASRRAEAAAATAQWQLLARETDLRQKRLAAIAADMAAWTGRMSGSSGQAAALEARFQEAVSEAETLAEAPAALAEQRRSLLTAIAEAEAAQKQVADRLVAGEKALADADRAARATLDELSRSREMAGRAEERLAAISDRLAALDAEILEAFHGGAEALPKLAGLDPQKPPLLKDQETTHAALLRERERLGAVNLLADQELKTAQDSFDTMIRERDDLIEAIRKLRGAIGALNREGRERLLASFEIVNGNFQRLFARLFGGGTAELQLIESDDPLEAGLDILAKPPGKKPQTLSLLSGGEQALTAIALIFAVFLTNPAPICVLDEVDAPLDDANVERYCDLLDEMTRVTATRFLVITHNPITMSRMDRLYGVTMVERGVSQLVSVNLEHAERLAAE